MARKPPSLTGLGLHLDRDGTYECTLPHALTQAAGYLKYIAGKRRAQVLVRGQNRHHGSLVPSLFRGEGPRASARVAMLDEFVELARSNDAFIKAERHVYEHAYEAILQHYGWRTPWIDLVDNLWVALWFAVNRCVVSPSNPAHWHYAPSDQPWAYVLFVTTGDRLQPLSRSPGVVTNDVCTLIDLRTAAPSFFLRPHAQHALLLRRNEIVDGDVTLDRQLLATIKVRTELAQQWLGAGFLHEPHVVFPPPHYDLGYAQLLDKAPDAPPELGAIATVFA